MCDKCANIDYPIGDPIWLPCGGPASRYQVKRTRRPPSDEDYRAQDIIRDLRARETQKNRTIKAQGDELKALRAGDSKTPTRDHPWDGPVI